MLQVGALLLRQACAGLIRMAEKWYAPWVCGLLYALCFPPFNHETHPLLFPFPFLGFVVLLPMFHFATARPLRRAVARSYVFGVTAVFGQIFWLVNVRLEGLWVTILTGLAVACLFLALLYFVAAMLFRVVHARFPRWYPLVFPAAWVLVDYGRSVGDMGFPWLFLGYSLTPLLPLAQAASVCGIYGLTFAVVLGNCLLWQWLVSPRTERWNRRRLAPPVLFVAFCAVVAVWGALRMSARQHGEGLKASVLQTNMDQGHWGRGSMDTSMAITESMVMAAGARDRPQLMVLPESALFCYLLHMPVLRKRVLAWVDSTQTPMILGTLHWEQPADRTWRDYLAYNAALLVDPATRQFQRYYKINLLPFSEALPFENAFPILNRVNLGESDFSRGNDPKVFDLGNGIRPAPFICYEIIFSGFVRDRVNRGANLLVNITNDGWWGKSSAAFHHAAMARMRSIENGVPLARSANTGISMLVDSYGRVLGKTRIYTREILTGTLPPALPRATPYRRLGDWPVGLSFAVMAGTMLVFLVRRRAAR